MQKTSEKIREEQKREALRRVMADVSAILCTRQNTHGIASDFFSSAAGFWSVYLKARQPGTGLCASDTASMMALFKIARTLHGQPNPDDDLDAIGYLALGLVEKLPEANE